MTDESVAIDDLPIDTLQQNDPDAMDVDEDEDPSASAVQKVEVQDYGIEVDFEDLDDDLKEVCCTRTHSMFYSKGFIDKVNRVARNRLRSDY